MPSNVGTFVLWVCRAMGTEPGRNVVAPHANTDARPPHLGQVGARMRLERAATMRRGVKRTLRANVRLAKP